VLHHFGSREALVEAVVARALDSLHAEVMASVKATPSGTDEVATLLDAVFQTLGTARHGRTFMWLALAGYRPAENLRVRSLAEAVHAVRCEKWKGRKEAPSFEDTYFTVLMPALTLMALSVVGMPEGEGARSPLSAARFRRWLAGVIHEHLEKGEG
jgi:AcrR family transcriptional regulator